MLEFTSCNKELSVKVKSLRTFLWTLYKSLHDIGHTVKRLLSEDIRRYRNISPADELHAVFLYNELKELHCLTALHFILGEEEHSHTEIALAADIMTELFCFTYKEAVGHLHHNANAVACFTLSVLACTVLKLFNNSKSTVHYVS